MLTKEQIDKLSIKELGEAVNNVTKELVELTEELHAQVKQRDKIFADMERTETKKEDAKTKLTNLMRELNVRTNQ